MIKLQITQEEVDVILNGLSCALGEGLEDDNDVDARVGLVRKLVEAGADIKTKTFLLEK